MQTPIGKLLEVNKVPKAPEITKSSLLHPENYSRRLSIAHNKIDVILHNSKSTGELNDAQREQLVDIMKDLQSMSTELMGK